MAVYFIQAGENGPVKIGFSANPRRRLTKMQSDHAQQLRIIRLFDAGEAEERELHAAFAVHRLSGEWFAPAPEIVSGPIALPPLKIGLRGPRPYKPLTVEARARMVQARKRDYSNPEWLARVKANAVARVPVVRASDCLYVIANHVRGNARVSRAELVAAYEEFAELVALHGDMIAFARRLGTGTDRTHAARIAWNGRRIIAAANGIPCEAHA